MAPRWHLPLLALVIGCAPPDTTGIKLIGHGGLGPAGAHPMNSREALLLALEQGLDGVELDVQMTADSVLVAHHDLVVSGSAECHGPVHTLAWADLNACTLPTPDVGAFHGVRLDELLREANLHYPTAEFTFDVKLNTKADWWTYLRQFSRAIHRLEKDQGMQGHIVVECRTADFLKALGEEAPEIPRFLYGDDAESTIREAVQLQCAGITMANERISAQQVALAKKQQLQVTLWGVGSWWSHRQAISKRPHRVQTDDPEGFAPREP